MFGGSPGSLPSVMGHRFSQVPAAEIQRSQFDRSHGYKTTFNAGDLVPFFVDEALPGDTFNLNVTTFARMATPITPVMDNLFCDTFFFFVPIRLIWDNFKKMMGEQLNPGDSTSYLVPQMTAPASGGHAVGSLSDYMGIPTGIASLSHSSLWHRAYNLCWNEWFRDQNLQNSVVVDKDDGPDSSTDYVLLKRGKRHDYFTSCLPWPQKGTAVTIPLGTEAPVLGIGKINNVYTASNKTVYESGKSATVTYNPWQYVDNNSLAEQFAVEQQAGTDFPNIRADLSNATAATINSLRQAFQIQRLYERDARGGTRYTELVRSHFGVVSPDARQQRPEFLGGGSTPITFTPIPKTGSTDATSPQGSLAAFATFTHGSNGFVKSFTEHGVILGLVSVRADLNYQQGLERMFSRRTRWDFYWPALAHLGEQAVLRKEICAQGTADDDIVFGYQEKYSEYRFKQSKITGQFRSTYATPLDQWHLAQEFSAAPELNSAFIQENPPMARVKAVTDAPDFLLDAYFRLKCARPMPTYGVPGMIDHF